MKNRMRVVVWLGIILFLGVRGKAEVIDKIVAILGDEAILLSEVREYAAAPVVQILANFDTVQNREDGALRYLLERHLLQREIQSLATPQETDFLKAIALQYISAAYYQQDDGLLAEKLQRQNISDAALNQELMAYMKGVDYIRRKYRFREDVSDPAVVLTRFREWLTDLQAQADIHVLF